MLSLEVIDFVYHFSLGVSYHGAAQSASGTKEQVDTYREQNKNLFQTISQFGSTGFVNLVLCN